MNALDEKLGVNLRTQNEKTTAEVREHVAEEIELADSDVLGHVRSLEREQTVLDLLDESPAN